MQYVASAMVYGTMYNAPANQNAIKVITHVSSFA